MDQPKMNGLSMQPSFFSDIFFRNAHVVRFFRMPGHKLDELFFVMASDHETACRIAFDFLKVSCHDTHLLSVLSSHNVRYPLLKEEH